MGDRLEQSIAVLNGAIGDHLARTGNGLATEMAFIANDVPVESTREGFATAFPAASPRLVVLVHGLMCTETIWRMADGLDYGSMLARDLGVTPLYLRYNSGRSIADNGRLLSALLDRLCEAFPVAIEDITLVGYSMGGLVARSACHVGGLAERPWLARVKKAVYVGTPHQGAPLERAGRVLTRILRAIPDPYTRLSADLADLRSDGVKDLGDGSFTDEQRLHRPRLGIRDARHPVPLLPGIEHSLIAASLSSDRWLRDLFGDALVPIPSATDGACLDEASFALPPDHIRIFPKLNHVALAHHPEVYLAVRHFCEAR